MTNPMGMAVLFRGTQELRYLGNGKLAFGDDSVIVAAVRGYLRRAEPTQVSRVIGPIGLGTRGASCPGTCHADS